MRGIYVGELSKRAYVCCVIRHLLTKKSVAETSATAVWAAQKSVAELSATLFFWPKPGVLYLALPQMWSF